MTRFQFLSCWFAATSFLAMPAVAHRPGPHVHGVASLQIAVDGNTLTLNLESPLDNLLGFEHLPRTENDKLAVRTMLDRLNRAETLFVPTPSAVCKPVSVKLESLVLQAGKTPAGDGHADLDGEFIFRCEHPDALRDIEVTLFDGLPHLRQVDVQAATPRGQTAAKLTRQQRRLSW